MHFEKSCIPINHLCVIMLRMNWFLLALMAPLTWSIANYLDKFLLSSSGDDDRGGSGGLLILSSLVSLLVAFGILLIHGRLGININFQNMIILIFSGIFEALYILFYFLALERESTTTVISLFQFTPILGLVFGYLLLKEVPTLAQMFAVLLILIGTLCIVYENGEEKAKIGILLLMLVATAFVGIYNTLFKLAGEQIPFWTAIFWQYTGIGIIGSLIFLTVPSYRKQSIYMIGQSGRKNLSITALAEGMNILALLATNAAILLAPIALVLSISSVQPVFVLIDGLLIVSIFPQLLPLSERPSLKATYLFGIFLVCLGGFLIYLF